MVKHNRTNFRTQDIVAEFMEGYLSERGYNWTFTLNHSDENDTTTRQLNEKYLHDFDYRLQLDAVRDSLHQIANELQEFIRNAYNERFKELTNILLDKLRDETKDNAYEAFKTVADELFSQGITWCRIVTFLVFDRELACRAIEVSKENEDNNNDGGYKMVSQIIQWECKYIDKNLLQWIRKQEGEWMNIKSFAIKGINNRGVGDRSTSNTYFGIAAFAVFIGGLYLCSKLTVQ